VTATSSDPATEAPKRGVIAAAIALGAHAVVVLASFVAARVVTPSGGGLQDVAAAVVTILGGEIVIGLACVIIGALQYRRGLRYTGLGLVGGWVVGFLAVMVLLCL
jgi:hypothetical protein